MEQPWPTNRVLTVERNYTRVKSLNVAHYDTTLMVTVTSWGKWNLGHKSFLLPKLPLRFWL